LSLFLQEDYDELLFLDIDSVVLKNLEPLFDFLTRFDIGFGEKTQKEWVYNESSDPKAFFGRDVPYYSSGMMLFRKKLLTKDMLEETVRFGCQKKLFHAWKGNDQAIINMAVMKYGLRHVDMKSSIWGFADFEVDDGRITSNPESQASVVHWAGNKRDVGRIPHIELIRHFDPQFSPGTRGQMLAERLRDKLGQVSAIAHCLR